MRHILTAAAALAISGFVFSAPVQAEPLYEQGGPVKVGNWCSIPDGAVDGRNGYMAPCQKSAKVAKITKKKAKRS